MTEMEKQILKKIKKYNTIVIARHIGADPDALGSSIGLKEIIQYNFPNKKVYAVGNPAARFKYMGTLDKMPDDINHALLIVTDTPDIKRIDGAILSEFEEVIKIDHHPFIEKFGSLEWIDDNASSVSQMIIKFVKNTGLKINQEIASKLYMGVVSDTERFLHDYTTTDTFDLVSWLIKKTNLPFTKLYPQLYMRNLNDIRFSGYIAQNLIVTENKLGYIILTEDILKENHVDSSTAGNLINTFGHIEEVLVLAFFSEDTANHYIKASIRSRGPIINEVAAHYHGGGHALASGAKPQTMEEVEAFIQALDQVCKEYNERESE